MSLVSRNYCFEASIMLNMLESLTSKCSVPSLIPQHHVLGHSCEIRSAEEESWTLISPAGSETKSVSKTLSCFVELPQLTVLLSILPIFRILSQIKAENEDESLQNLI